ncbi:D-alanyl-D-alanine endopeptidase [Marinobacter zhejiangensis]|uniref:D-alanyl-D-alanine endopeptidase (Penicillin-binding protein 7) n=1 Tax=Marinobacter zhejiangensis TaxID=488535 RepID=A0A1I4L5Y1_9GAMM|nr:D-alanyl-D-alanine endopeptidase [Marinobacter zhejiangensis]SFL86380.1 D-alanyl-D-alanine endopeptidase (penicillin-binding protein 7) [Marinobacter zhejiangensis]
MRSSILISFLVLLVSSALSAQADTSPLPNLASVNAAAAYLDDGELLLSKNADREVPIASITKLMTALVVLESGQSLDEPLEFLARHQQAPNNAYTRIRVGSTLRRGDVLRIALMSSENFAAYTLARHHPGGYDAFVAAMNRQAETLGMTGTHFVDPTGLSAGNYSTAADLVKLVVAASAHEAIREYSTTQYFTANFRQPRYTLDFGNTNILVHRDSWDVALSKTGYLNEAGRCLVMVSELDGRDVVMVLLDSFGSRSPVGDAGRIKRWLRTGDLGRVAGAAKAYEQRRNPQFAAADSARTVN